MKRTGEPLSRRSNRKRAEQTAQSLIAALLLGTASGCATFDMDHARVAPYSQGRAPRPVIVVYVQRGDTVAGIARRYGLSMQAVIDANGLDEPYQLKRGQRLILPPSTATAFEPRETAPVARTYRAAPRPVIETSELAPPEAPKAKVRSTPVVEVDDPKPAAQAKSAGADPRLLGARYYAMSSPRPKPVLDGQGGPLEVEPPRESKIAAVRREKPVRELVSETSTGRFVWPVEGKIISSFGRRASGVHNDGINIACEPGSAVKAADSGVVVYDGNELTAYGNLLLVRHSSGFVTAYAHNKKLLVQRGDAVRQGQTIALAGSTGDVDRPQLHFEIRKGDRAVDPNRYLSRATASR